jgi:hypothetical protein
VFNQIKLYIYGAIAAAGLFVVGMLKYLSAKNKSLEKEVETNKKNVAVLEKASDDRKELDKAVAEVKAEAQAVERENNEKRAKKIRPSVGDSFGDKRLK